MTILQKTLPRRHAEHHHTSSTGWLRAAVLGANDGIVSTGSLIIGVAVTSASSSNVLIAGVAGLVAGAMSMAAGEYVSVHSQEDTEKADLAREAGEIKKNPDAEHRELTAIYVGRGLEADLAKQVADQLMAYDALGAHARDELGISAALKAQPVTAAIASAASFAVGAILPLAAAAWASHSMLIASVSVISLVFLAVLGSVAAKVGGANAWIGAWRVTFWGALAMLITAGVGILFSAVV